MKLLRWININGKAFLKSRRYLWEVLFGFIALDVLNVIFYPQDLGFRNMPVSPYWVVILLIAVQYGFVAGFVAGLVAGIHYVIFLFQGIPTVTVLERVIETRGLIMPVLFILTGVFLGEIRQKHLESETQSKEKLREAESVTKRMRQWLESGEKARRVLEARVVKQTTTVRALYEAARKFESLDLDQVYKACLEILSAHFQVERSSLYMKEYHYYILKAAWGNNAQKVIEGKIPMGVSLMDMAMKENRLVTVRDILSRPDSQKYISQYGEVLAMVPMHDDSGNPIGVVNIEKMDFLAFTKPTLEMIELMVEWTSHTIRNINFFNATRDKLTQDEEYQIGNYYYFEAMLRNEFFRAKNFGLPLTVALLKLKRYGFLPVETQKLLAQTLVSFLKHNASETDQIYRYRYDGTFVLIAPMKSRGDIEFFLSHVAAELKKVTGDLAFSAVEAGYEMRSPLELMEPMLRECRIGDFV